ncbi:hypothetical protein G7007_16950 [Pseudomonas entomophila]|uniref:hypothetical protein n=1 Tax=Pseudomonas entomophila TaxID=312306 RepID=UPI0015E32C0B|nr:hypothetical protein [Pseudomonas entomophila]MBA1194524.1 hypothetical protein [Pseudomonas entomophila]
MSTSHVSPDGQPCGSMFWSVRTIEQRLKAVPARIESTTMTPQKLLTYLPRDLVEPITRDVAQATAWQMLGPEKRPLNPDGTGARDAAGA